MGSLQLGGIIQPTQIYGLVLRFVSYELARRVGGTKRVDILRQKHHNISFSTVLIIIKKSKI